MRLLISFVKDWLIPGSLSFLLLGLAAGVVLLHAGPAAWWLGRVWLTTLAMSYLALSLPAVAAALLSRVASAYPTIREPHQARGATTLVVVGNGSVHYTDGEHRIDYLTRRSVFCGFEAARLYALCRPRLVVTTGGAPAGRPAAIPEAALLRDLLVASGVPAETIVAEVHSRTTAEQARNVGRLLAERGAGSPILIVTTSAHMPRVDGSFRAEGLDLVCSVTPELRYDEGRNGWRRWVPSMSALTGSTSAMYEFLARIYSSPA